VGGTLERDYYTSVETDSAISSATATLKAEIEDPVGTSLGATLAEEHYTATETDSAIAAEISTLKAQIEDPNGTSLGATLATDYATVAEIDSTISSANSVLKAEIEDPNGTSLGATVDDLAATRVTAAGAVAAVETEISASYADMTALASATAFAEATVSGIQSGYVWSLGGDDVLSLVQVSDGTTAPTTTARIKSDLIQLDGDTTVTGEFTVGSANIADAAITTAKIDDLSVDTIKIQNQSVTTTRVASSFSEVTMGGWVTVCALTFTPYEAGVSLLVMCRAKSVRIGGVTPPTNNVTGMSTRLLYNGNLIGDEGDVRATAGPQVFGPPRTSFVDIAEVQAAAGPATIELQIYLWPTAYNGNEGRNFVLAVSEFKR